jgi:hypothetical protein
MTAVRHEMSNEGDNGQVAGVAMIRRDSHTVI